MFISNKLLALGFVYFNRIQFVLLVLFLPNTGDWESENWKWENYVVNTLIDSYKFKRGNNQLTFQFSFI